MTSHIYGLEKILEVKWKLDEQKGRGFDNNYQMDLFLETEEQSKLKTSLTNYLKEQRTNWDVYEFTLKQGFLPKHTNTILRELQQGDRLKITPKSTRKGSFYINFDEYKEKYKEDPKITIQLNVN